MCNILVGQLAVVKDLIMEKNERSIRSAREIRPPCRIRGPHSYFRNSNPRHIDVHDALFFDGDDMSSMTYLSNNKRN